MSHCRARANKLPHFSLFQEVGSRQARTCGTFRPRSGEGHGPTGRAASNSRTAEALGASSIGLNLPFAFPPRPGHLINAPDPPEADTFGELTSFENVRIGKRPPQEPQQARAEHVGDRGGGASRRPVPGCLRGARRDRGPAGPKETQGPGEARAAEKAPLIMAAARKRGARQYASAIVL